MGTTTRKIYNNESSEHRALLLKAKETEFNDQQSLLRFRLQVRKSKEDKEDEFKLLLHTLARRCGEEFYDTNGPALLGFIVSHDEEYVLNLINEQTKKESKENPIHVAISKENHGFMESILSLADHFNTVDQIAAALKQTDNRDYTCLHAAIEKKLPCVPAMVGVCARIARNAFSVEGSGKNTPLHLLMDTDPFIWTVYDIESNDYSVLHFNPRVVLEGMKTWLDTDMGPLWTKLNKSGLSPYLKRLDLKEIADKEEVDYRAYLKSQIFEFRLSISEIKKGLYGNGEEKELCLDMSDFNQSSHDFTMFVSEMVKPPEKKNPPIKELLSFEENLIYVFLPDLTTFKKKVPHTGVRTLFEWLSETARVKTIKSLNIPDSITTPMSDELVSEAIIDRFVIEKFDWRKLDINLDILTRSDHKDKFTDLTLYSSGNWSVLYHWISPHGLQKLTGLQKVTINIVEPNTPYKETKVKDRHDDLVRDYKKRLTDHFTEVNKRKVAKGINFDGKVIPNQKWNFEAPQYTTDGGDMKLEIIEKLKACHNFLDSLKERAELQAKVQKVKAEADQDQTLKYWQRFANLTESPKSGKEDRRIRVAIIDNGADKFRLLVKDAIEKGASFVKIDSDGESRTLPWWMVSDPHGTQMASLIRDTNPYCRLYIARVGRGRRDILPEDAVEAINWAAEQNVDVISISWIIKEPFPALLTAVENAARKSLVICSTADEGAWSGDVYPADWNSMVKVAATDKYGNLSPKSDKCAVNIAVPGENIPAFGPSYMGTELAASKISGSSVATALAAGVASLALLLLQVFNEVNRDELRTGRYFYNNRGMAQVLSSLKSSANMSNFFPTDLNKLPDLWNLDKLEQWLERELNIGNKR